VDKANGFAQSRCRDLHPPRKLGLFLCDYVGCRHTGSRILAARGHLDLGCGGIYSNSLACIRADDLGGAECITTSPTVLSANLHMKDQRERERERVQHH
jgi:hypothetical protein